MVLSIKDNGKELFGKVTEYKFGLMVLDMRVIGRMTWQTVKGSSPTFMEMSTKGIGLMIKPMVLEFIHITKMANTKVIGLMMCNMDMANRHGLMDQHMRVNI